MVDLTTLVPRSVTSRTLRRLRGGGICRRMTSPTHGTVWFRTGPPRRLAGLSVRGYVVRHGVLLPPPDGPARAAALKAAGGDLLADARRGYGRVLREILAVAGGVPARVDLDRPWRSDLARGLVASRRGAWEQTRRRLVAADTVNLDDLERRSRAALDAAVDAFDHLEDTDLAAKAHAQAHVIGELVGGLFGCRAEREDGRWFDVCRLSLMHLRVGLSAGFVAKRHCSICDGDLSECEHMPGTVYGMVAARNSDNVCTVCDDTDCLDHVPGEAYSVVAHAVVRQADLDEISIVPRPRDPLARPSGVELPAEEVMALPGSGRADAVLECHRCTSPCTGFTSAEEAIGLS